MLIHDPGGTGKRIDTLYVCLAGPEDDEGIVGLNGLPLVFSNPDILPAVEQKLQDLVAGTNKPVRIVKFETRTELRTIR